ncbi:MAG: hypothetical protein ACI81L_000821 [Verrucomicrobiales bacterium]|jgi:hypothetical protein
MPVATFPPPVYARAITGWLKLHVEFPTIPETQRRMEIPNGANAWRGVGNLGPEM